MAIFEDVDSALRFIEQSISTSVNTLKKELKEEAMVQGAKLYATYSPRTGYQRRGSVTNSSLFSVTSYKRGDFWEIEGQSHVTGRKGFSGLPEVLESGRGGNWRGVPARKWVSEWTSNEFKVIAEQIVRESLATQGIL